MCKHTTQSIAFVHNFPSALKMTMFTLKCTFSIGIYFMNKTNANEQWKKRIQSPPLKSCFVSPILFWMSSHLISYFNMRSFRDIQATWSHHMNLSTVLHPSVARIFPFLMLNNFSLVLFFSSFFFHLIWFAQIDIQILSLPSYNDRHMHKQQLNIWELGNIANQNFSIKSSVVAKTLSQSSTWRWFRVVRCLIAHRSLSVCEWAHETDP